VTAEARPTILVVDDEASMRRLIVRILGDDFVVMEADGAASALELCTRHVGAIDLLLTDVVLPGVNGCRLSELVREMRPTVRTLFISGYGPEILAKHGASAASGSFLAKPFTHAELRERVRAILNERSQEAP